LASADEDDLSILRSIARNSWRNSDDGGQMKENGCRRAVDSRRRIPPLLVGLVVLGISGTTPGARAGEVAGFGTVSFPTSCAASVAKPFEMAVAKLHSFIPAADEFAAIAKTDRNCAMAWWGAAMSARGNPLGGVLDTDALRKGSAFLRRAKAAQAKTERERAFIDALDVYYRDYGRGGHAARTQAYEAAMERVLRAYPDDPEAAAFYALRTPSSRNGDSASPIRKCAAASMFANSDTCTIGMSASGNATFNGMKTP
jgi:hypothetical protein